MAQLNFTEKINEATKNITSPEQDLGKGLMMPFNGANAGVIAAQCIQ